MCWFLIYNNNSRDTLSLMPMMFSKLRVYQHWYLLNISLKTSANLMEGTYICEVLSDQGFYNWYLLHFSWTTNYWKHWNKDSVNNTIVKTAFTQVLTVAEENALQSSKTTVGHESFGTTPCLLTCNLPLKGAAKWRYSSGELRKNIAVWIEHHSPVTAALLVMQHEKLLQHPKYH